jgi:hypothetical protein
MNFTAAADETAPVLIVGGGAAWCDAARERAAQTGLPLDAVRIGHLDGDLFDPRCAWVRQREVAPPARAHATAGAAS